MAEIEIVTLNALGDGWIDVLPGPVSTGYQAQNTNFTARTLGLDLTTVIVEGTSVILKGNSGAIDENGVPYCVKNDIVFPFSGIGLGVSWIEFTPGATATERIGALTQIPPTWDPVKNGLYSASGYRVLNWSISNEGETDYVVHRLHNEQTTNLESMVSGIQRGGLRDFTSPGSSFLPILETGVYELFCIAGGEAFSGTGTITGGSGGGSAKSVLRLQAGTVLTVTVGAADINSKIESSGLISVEAIKGGSGAVTGSLPRYSEATHSGGDGALNDIGSRVTGGGGAGRYSSGGNGWSYRNENDGVSRRDGENRFELFGLGDGGTGFAEVRWISG